jgi:hypothetical protein
VTDTGKLSHHGARPLSASSVTTVVMSRSMSWKNCQAPDDCSYATLSGMALPYDDVLRGVVRLADCVAARH